MQLNIENSEAITRLMARLRKLQNPDATPLMATWMRLIVEDNRRGVLAGLDKDGNALAPVTYRPIATVKRTKTPVGYRFDLVTEGAKLTREQKLGVTRGKTGRFGGHGPLASGLHNNLTYAEYKQLGGPPLAPRGPFSRVITNLKTEFAQQDSGVFSGRSAWMAYGWWDQVVARDGTTKFLKYHFHGIGQKKRDLTGVRPEGVKKARAAAINWMRDMVRSGGV